MQRRSPILIERGMDRGLVAMLVASVLAHVAVILLLLVWGKLDLRPGREETYTVDMVGGIPADGIPGKLPPLSAGKDRRAATTRAPPRAAERKPDPKPLPKAKQPPEPAKQQPTKELKSKEPPDVILPGGPTATPSPSPRPILTPSPIPTEAPTPRVTAAPSTTPRPTLTVRATATPRPSGRPTSTPRATAQATPKARATAQATATPRATATSVAAARPAATRAPVARVAATAKPRPSPTARLVRATPSPSRPQGIEPGVAPRGAGEPAREDPAPRATAGVGGAGQERDTRIAQALDRIRQRVGGAGGSSSGGGTQAGAGGGQGSGGGGGGVGRGAGGAGELRGAEFLLYYNEMIMRIRDAWVWVGGATNVEVKVEFRIMDDGQIVDVRLLERSGDASYDESVLRAVRGVGRLAPPPERYRRDFEDVELTFRPADLQSNE